MTLLIFFKTIIFTFALYATSINLYAVKFSDRGKILPVADSGIMAVLWGIFYLLTQL